MPARLIALTKSFEFLHPHLLQYWDYTKNDKKPRDFGSQSSVIIWWQCPDKPQHSWKAKIVLMAKAAVPGCPYCSLRQLHSDNSLAALYPHIAKEFDMQKNCLSPAEVIGNQSNKKYWFKCETGHEWEASLSNRIGKGSNCPACSGRVAHQKNSLAALFPQIAAELDVKRSGVTADNVVAGSEKRLWWKCKAENHLWETMPYTRTKFGAGCPYCVNQKINKENSLAAKFPNIAIEFNASKNGTTADQVGAGALKYVWWKCIAKGHEWQSYVSNRTSQNMKCPRCSMNFTSQIEKDFRAAFARTRFFDSVENDTVRLTISPDRRKFLEVDIMAQKNDQKIAIEYDGSYYHHDKEIKDSRKTRQLLELGYIVVRIREQSKSWKLSPLKVKHKKFIQVAYEYKQNKANFQDTVSEVLKQLEAIVMKDGNM